MNLTQYRWVQGWHINAHYVLFGGKMLSWVDEDTMMLVSLNSKVGSVYVTKGFERVNFVKPVRQGDKLCFNHKIVYLGVTSLWTWSDVVKEDGDTVFNCYTSLVAVDIKGFPKYIDLSINPEVRKGVKKDNHWETIELLKELY